MPHVIQPAGESRGVSGDEWWTLEGSFAPRLEGRSCFPARDGEDGRVLLKTIGWSLLLALPVMASPKVDFAHGVLKEARGERATGLYEKALAEDPDAWPLTRKVVNLRFAAGDLEGATTLFREFTERHPHRLGPQLAYADFLQQAAPNDDFGAKLACDALERALAQFPGEISVVRRLFRFYEQREMRESSLALFEQTSQVEGAAAALAAAEMARNLFPADDMETRGRLDRIFEQAMKGDPADRVLARSASEHFRRSGRVTDAARMLQQHVEAMPSSLALRIRLGVLWLSAGMEAKGRRELEAVLEIDPRQALAHQALAKLHRQNDRVVEARPHAAAVLKIRGGDADEFVSLADEHLAEGLVREARLLLEKGFYDHPEDAAIAVSLAIATRRDPETRASAVRAFREAEALSGEDGPATRPEFQLEFAECLLEAGMSEAAEDRLRAAIKAYPPDATAEMAVAMRRLAEIWVAEGRNESAARSLLRRAESLEKK